MTSSSKSAPDPLGSVALDGDLVAPHGDVHAVEGLFDQAQQLVALAEQADHEMVAGDEDLDLGGCHVRSGPDATSGSAAAIPWSTRAHGPTGPAGRRPLSPAASPTPAAEDVQVEVGDRVEGVLAHVEHQPVAAVGTTDPLGVGHRLGRHQQGGDVLGVARRSTTRGVDDVAHGHDQHVHGRLGVEVPEGHGALVGPARCRPGRRRRRCRRRGSRSPAVSRLGSGAGRPARDRGRGRSP